MRTCLWRRRRKFSVGSPLVIEGFRALSHTYFQKVCIFYGTLGLGVCGCICARSAPQVIVCFFVCLCALHSKGQAFHSPSPANIQTATYHTPPPAPPLIGPMHVMLSSFCTFFCTFLHTAVRSCNEPILQITSHRLRRLATGIHEPSPPTATLRLIPKPTQNQGGHSYWSGGATSFTRPQAV